MEFGISNQYKFKSQKCGKSGTHLLNTNGNIGLTNTAVYVEKTDQNNESGVYENLA